MGDLKIIKLREDEWRYDETKLLGPEGGFGAVFLGFDSVGNEVAVKRLKVDSEDSGHRELRIAEELKQHQFAHVIPLFDSGVDAESDRYFLVMAKADQSLQDLLKANPEGVDEETSVEILKQIAFGLKEASDFVHRDLKPGNVLLHDGKWKISDFGIARFVEESTSLNTLKGCLSPDYAAPEQWRLERATSATDVYALGCIAYSLIAGKPPFHDAAREEKGECHLHKEPSQLDVSRRLAQLLSTCLRKSPQARPSVDAIIRQLESLIEAKSLISPLVSVAASIAGEQARSEAEAARQRTEREQRQELANDGLGILREYLEELWDVVERDAPIAQVDRGRNRATLGSGLLSVSISFPFLEARTFGASKWDVVAGALIRVTQDSSRYPERSANLWYGNLDESGVFGWWEVSYWKIWGPKQRRQPFGISDDGEIGDADLAASMSQHTHSIALKAPIDREHFVSFMTRWIERFAQAAENKMQNSGSSPERI